MLMNLRADAIRTSRWRYVANVKYDPLHYKPLWNELLSEQLYDVDNEIHETENLASAATEPVMKGLMAQMQKMLAETQN